MYKFEMEKMCDFHVGVVSSTLFEMIIIERTKKTEYGLMMTTIPINIKWFFNKYTFQPVVVGRVGGPFIALFVRMCIIAV